MTALGQPSDLSRSSVPRRFVAFNALLSVLCVAWIAWPETIPAVTFPEGRKFAFSIVDDTDMASLERLRPVYDVLERYGLRTTKTIWVYAAKDTSHAPDSGDSLENPAYREFVLDLHRKGFEIALHGVRGGSSSRDETLAGLEEFRATFGQYPRLHVNHSLNRENLYWGRHLYTFAPLRWAVGLASATEFSGHDPSSPYFWGDAAQTHIRYVRRFTFGDLNLLKVNPRMPYRLDDMPYVNYWFPTADGNRVIDFVELLKDENLERLEREGGVCLVYAHLGAGSFSAPNGVDPRFEDRIRAVAARGGWFVPASEILDHLASHPSWTGQMSVRERARLDLRFLKYRLGI